MERIVVKLEDPATEPDGLAEQSAALAAHLSGAEVVRVSGSGRVLLTVPDGAASEAVEQLSALSSVAWAEADSIDSAQSESSASDVTQSGVAQPADGDSESS